MLITEKLLCCLARKFSRGQMAHSDEMKDALNNREQYNAYLQVKRGHPEIVANGEVL